MPQVDQQALAKLNAVLGPSSGLAVFEPASRPYKPQLSSSILSFHD